MARMDISLKGKIDMKAILITVPLLALMVSPSLARPLKLPNTMLGEWCYAEEGKGEYMRARDCGADESLYLDRKFYGGHEFSCEAISKIVRRGNVWQARYRCKNTDEKYVTVQWKLIKNGTRLKFDTK